jgi:transposase
MPSKKIKRRVVKLDTSNQGCLFEDAQISSSTADKGRLSSASSLVEFIDPDPRDILLNQVRLDEHLKQTGQTQALQVRILLEALDWCKFEQDYKPGGRRPYAPRAMLGLILYGIMQGISSLRLLEGLARTDLGCMWISGGILPDHSVIGRFIQRHEGLLSGEFFEQLTARVLKATRSGTQTVAGDGSVIEAAASRFNLMKAEALSQAIEKARSRLATSGEAEAEKQQQQLVQLDQAQTVLRAREQQRRAKGKPSDTVQINVQEPDAVIQPQKDKKRFVASYKPSVLANEIRVIVGLAVDPSSETGVVEGMLQQAQRLGGIDTALFDAGYFSEGVIKATVAQEIELLCPEGQSRGDNWRKCSDKYYPKSQFRYDPEQDVYHCPQGHVLRPVGRYQGNERYPGYVCYGTDACGHCAHRDACTKNAKGRQIKRYAADEAKDALREKMQQPQAQARYLKRQGMVEPVFSHLRYRQGLNRFRRKGLKAVRLEFSLHAMAYNLSRVLAIDGFFATYWGRCSDYAVFNQLAKVISRLMTKSPVYSVHAVTA